MRMIRFKKEIALLILICYQMHKSGSVLTGHLCERYCYASHRIYCFRLFAGIALPCL